MPKKVVFTLILISIVTIFMFCFGEIVIRLFGYRGERFLRMSYAYKVDDPIINYRFKPGTTYYIGNVGYHFNRNGMRDRDIPVRKEKGIYRIVMLGDSVAEGYGVHLEDTVGKQLESLMNENNGGKSEVVNIAMSGLNTFQEAHLFETIGIKYKPDLIIIAYILNDPDNGVYFKENTEEGKYTKINMFNIRVPIWIKNTLKKSALIFFIKNRVDRLMWRYDVKDSDDNFNSIKSDFFHKIHNNEEKWHNTLDGFSKISEKAKELHCDVIMVIFPIMYDFENYNWMNIHTKVRTAGDNHGFSVIDFFNEYSKHPVKSVRLERGDFVHPNAKGHKIAADVLFNYIKNNISLKK